MRSHMLLLFAMLLPSSSIVSAYALRPSLHQSVNPHSKFSMGRHGAVHAAAPTRTPLPPMMGFFDWLGPEEPETLGSEAAACVAALCSTNGWECQLEIGSEVAKAVGGSGELAKRKDATSTGSLTLLVRFHLDDGFSPPQGKVDLLRASRFFAPETAERNGFWKTTEDLDNGVPTQVQWRLQTSSDGLVLGDDTLVPGDTKLYFNAKADFDEDSGALRLYDGRVTVKEDLGANVGIFAAKGILAEFKIVGTFECKSGRATD